MKKVISKSNLLSLIMYNFFQFFCRECEFSDSPILRNSGISDSRNISLCNLQPYNIVFVTTFHIIEKCYFSGKKDMVIFKCSFLHQNLFWSCFLIFFHILSQCLQSLCEGVRDNISLHNKQFISGHNSENIFNMCNFRYGKKIVIV